MKSLIILAVVGVLGFVGYRFAFSSVGASKGQELAPETLFAARRGPLKITVVENGSLKAKNSTEVSPEFQREGLITWLVSEGKSVELDEVLAEFDKTDLETQIDEKKRQLLQAQNEFETAKAELEIQRRDAGAQIEAAEFNLEVTQLKLQRYVEGEAPNTRRKLGLDIEKADADYERAVERYEQVPALAKEGFMTRLQAEQERLRLKESAILKENAHKEKELYERYNEPMERRQLEVAVKDAERALINAREKSQISVRERETRVSRAESSLKQTQTQLEKLEKDLVKMTIKAPRPGIVHYGDPGEPWMRDQIKVGGRFYRGNTLFTLPDLSEMQAMVKVHEGDISQVELDQEVVVTVEAVKGETFMGKVTRVNAVADRDWVDEANKRYACEITLEPTEVELRAGLTAKVEILIDELPDVVHVPVHAVVAEGGQYFCFLPGEQGFTKRAVEIGPNNAHYVVITKGLEEGEKVLLYDPRDAGGAERAEEPSATEGGLAGEGLEEPLGAPAPAQ